MIDWDKPLEAVSGTGVVSPIKLDCDGPDRDGDYETEYDNNIPLYWTKDGIPSRIAGYYDNPWRIRNVADTDTVVVKRMTRDEARAAGEAIEKIDAKYCFAYVAEKLFRDAGLIKHDPTPSERFKADNPQWSLRDRADLIEDVLVWKEKQ